MYRPLLLAACAAGALLPVAATAQHRHAMPMPGASPATAAPTSTPRPDRRQRARVAPAKMRKPDITRVAPRGSGQVPSPDPTGAHRTARAMPAQHGSMSPDRAHADLGATAPIGSTVDHADMSHAGHIGAAPSGIASFNAASSVTRTALHGTAGIAGDDQARSGHEQDAPGAATGSSTDHARMNHGAQAAPAQEQTPTDHAKMDHAAMDHGAMNHATMGGTAMNQGAMNHAAMGHAMSFTAPLAWRRASDAALARAPVGAAMSGMTMGTANGWYSPGSGTARLPAAEGPMRGAMFSAGEWMVMAHGYAWGSVTDQGGPRGADMAFVQSMAMLMGDRDLGDRFHLQLRAMGSLEPAMGQRGYPNLFATGETANGVPLVDRQHPHDLFMELAARVDYRLGGDTNLFLYGGPVGEPALGPSAFMHRGSSRYQPLSPITHHWFDSTHITYGVVTAGVSAPRFQLEGSWFKGREPDEERWDIDPVRLDSWSLRGTWTPSPFLAVQVSHGHLKEPEVQHPGEDENRTTASVQWARGGVATTIAWSRKDRQPGDVLNAWLAEATWEISPAHAIFARVENVANDEFFPDHDSPLHDRRFRVTKAEGGYAYRLPIVGALGVALGGTVAAYAKPDALDAAYGDDPVSWTLFAKLAVGL